MGCSCDPLFGRFRRPQLPELIVDGDVADRAVEEQDGDVVEDIAQVLSRESGEIGREEVGAGVAAQRIVTSRIFL